MIEHNGRRVSPADYATTASIHLCPEAWAAVRGAINSRLDALDPETDYEDIIYLNAALRQIDDALKPTAPSSP